MPLIANTACTKNELDVIGPQFKSAVASFNCNSVFADHWNVKIDKFEFEFDCYSKLCSQYVGTEKNVYLTDAQKELLLLHWRLGINMYLMQELMHMYTT